MASLRISQYTFLKLLYVLLLLIPLSFKIELVPDVILYPQDLFFPLLLLLYLIFSGFRLSSFSWMVPYYFLLFALSIVFLSTLISFIDVVSVSGLLKTLKYILYVLVIIAVSKLHVSNLLRHFNRVAFITILVTLILFVWGKNESGLLWGDYMGLATWHVDIMPTGFSNLVFNPYSKSFIRYSGNHGIYGSYVVLVYIVNLSVILDKRLMRSSFNYIVLALALVNLMLLTSRESFMVFLIVHLLAAFSYFFLRKKVSIIYVSGIIIGIALLSLVFIFLWNADVDVVLINKIKYTFKSLSSSGGETNVSLRFAVWHLTLISFYLHPLALLTGYGNNLHRYGEALIEANMVEGNYANFASVPESFFNTFLAFGGIFALFLGLLFFLTLLLSLNKRYIMSSMIGKLLFFLGVGLFLSNNTGASMLADLLMTQFALLYIWVNQFYTSSHRI